MFHLEDVAHTARTKNGDDPVIPDVLAHVKAHGYFSSTYKAGPLSYAPERVIPVRLGKRRGHRETERPSGYDNLSQYGLEVSFRYR